MHLLGKAMDKDFWRQVREKDCYAGFREGLFELWEKHCENGPIQALRYSDFKRYWVDGNRGIYEQTYFTRRLAIDCAALLALVYPEENRYLDRLMDEIYAICDEYTWCLPAHQGVLEENNNTVIDLFAAETAFALSEIYTVLEDRLEPLIKNRILAEVDRRVFVPFTSVESYSWWESHTNNWVAVCTGSVAGSFMLLRPQEAERLLPRFEKSMAGYLAGLGEDGYCMEGCSYWHYGFGFFTVYADLVRSFTEGRIDWFRNEKVRKAATFIQKMFLSGDACVSFSDSARQLRYHLGLCHYLKDQYPEDVVVFDPKDSYAYDHCGRFCLHMRTATWLNEDTYYHPTPNEAAAEYYSADAQWLIKRTAAYGFAAKGGHNGELHNNNDVGTFIFAKNGRQVLADLGPGVYSRQYFSEERYSILESSSRGHSVPIVDGQLQFAGREAAAVNTKYENGVFSTDIAGAYRCEGLTGLRRRFDFTEDAVTLTDEFDYMGTGEITERIVTLFEPTVEGDTVRAADVTISFDPGICRVCVGSERAGRGGTCYFIDFTLKNQERTFTCRIR